MVLKSQKLVTLLIAGCIALVQLPLLASQSGSTPEADTPSVHFSLHAVGDFEHNYFDDVEMLPGESQTLEVRVANWSDDPVDLRMYATNAGNAPNGGFQAGAYEDEITGSAAWVQLTTDELTLQGQEQRVVPFTIAVPEDAAPGQHISAVVVETVDTLPIPGDDSIDHRIRYGISVSVLIPGEITYSFELGEPTLSADSLEIPITNTGNYLIRPAGEIELRDVSGEVLMSAPIQLGSIYAGVSTSILLGLPAPLPEDDYTLSLTLTDPDSDATATLIDVPVARADSEVEEESPQVSVQSAGIEPNAADITFAQVELVLFNDYQQTPVNVVLEIYRDGELVEDIALATNQIFLHGENTYTTRYLPAEGWESGTYTFSVRVDAVNPETNQATVLLNEDLDAEIVVP